MSTPDTTTRPALTFTTFAAPCVTADCCDCGPAAWEEERSPHFTTIETARRYLGEAGWTRATAPATVTGEQWRCRDCSAARACAIDGHQPYAPQPWFDPRTGVRFQDGQVCERCNIELTKPIRKLPPADYPAADPLVRHLYWDHASLPEGADLTAAVAVLISQANTAGWLERWNAYLTAHPDAVLHDRDDALDVAAGIAAAEEVIRLAGLLRQRLADTTVPPTTAHMLNAPR